MYHVESVMQPGCAIRGCVGPPGPALQLGSSYGRWSARDHSVSHWKDQFDSLLAMHKDTPQVQQQYCLIQALIFDLSIA